MSSDAESNQARRVTVAGQPVSDYSGTHCPLASIFLTVTSHKDMFDVSEVRDLEQVLGPFLFAVHFEIQSSGLSPKRYASYLRRSHIRCQLRSRLSRPMLLQPQHLTGNCTFRRIRLIVAIASAKTPSATIDCRVPLTPAARTSRSKGRR